MRLTRAVTHIRLCAANHAKVATLDALAAEYRALCQQYVTLFCAEAEPNGFSDPCFSSPLSQRWQRVAIQQAAGIARSWRSNHQRAQEEFADTLTTWLEEEHALEEIPPPWTPWQTPILKKTVIPANANVALLQPSQATAFASWLRVATLEKGQPLFLPVRLAAYHQRCVAGKPVDSSVTLLRKANGWWLTRTDEEEIPVQAPPDAPVVGVDVGVTHFLTTSMEKRYGSFQGTLTKRHQRDREIQSCRTRQELKALLQARHQRWRAQTGWS